MERRNTASTPQVLALAFLVGCSSVDPQVGSSQESCGVDAASPATAKGSAGYSSTSSGPGTPQTGASLVCMLDAGSPCDDCESTYCCTTRTACYTDPVCICADRALDLCSDSTDNGGATPSAQTAACWAAFSARGTVEQARVACEKAWCATACALP